MRPPRPEERLLGRAHCQRVRLRRHVRKVLPAVGALEVDGHVAAHRRHPQRAAVVALHARRQGVEERPQAAGVAPRVGQAALAAAPLLRSKRPAASQVLRVSQDVFPKFHAFGLPAP